MSSHQTMTPTEEARWLKAVQDGSLWECQDEWEASEQMALWRQAGNTLKEIGLVYGVMPGTVWVRVKRYEERK